MRTVMEHKGYKAQIMEAPRLTGDQVHGLPPGTPLEVYPVDAFKMAPENWMRGDGVFVCSVKPNKGLWFDWRGNSEINTAIIPTVKGCNPITGLQTTGFHLEKYEKKCPKHNCDFLAERFCPECNYKWPDRNYQSMSPSWWDGFRSDDGTVRQFFFSEDELRDVASGLIGKENTIPAFGFAFYAPKERRQEPATMFRGLITGNYTNVDYGSTGHKGWGGTTITCDSYNLGSSGSQSVFCCSVTESLTLGSLQEEQILPVKEGPIRDRMLRCKNVKEVSVGAGAKISQSLNLDTYGLDTWKDTPDATMTIYFVFQDKFDEIAAGGLRDLAGSKEGFLSNITVG